MGRDRSYSRGNPLPSSSRFSSKKVTADVLKNIFDVLLILLVIACPFVFAGRHAMGQLIYSVVCGLLAITWLVRQQTKHRQPWIFTGLEPWVFLGIIICILQVIPLPLEVIKKISPAQSDLLFIFNQQQSNPDIPQYTWNTISVDPYESAQNTCTVIMFFLAGIMIRQRLRSMADVYQLTAYVGVAGVLISIFALLQFYLSNGKFFWFYEHFQTNTYTEVKGPFSNANHFAGYACTTLIPVLLLGFYYLFENEKQNSWSSRNSSMNSDTPFLYSLGCFGLFLMMVVAAIMSASRGALVLLGGELLFLFMVFSFKKLMNGKVFLAFIGLGFIASAGLFLMADKIFEANTQEILASADSEKLDPNAGRRTIWQANIRMIQQYPWLGTGMGTHYDVHTAYMDAYSPGLIFSHAENSYLNIGTEAGVIALSLFLILLFAPLLWGVQILYDSRDPKQILTATGLLMGLMVLMTHAVYDFNFYTPAIAMNFVLILGMTHQLYREYRHTADLNTVQNTTSWNPGNMLQLVCVTCLLGIAIYIQLPPALAGYDWDRYQKLSTIKHEDPDDAMELLALRVRHLQNVVRIHPQHALAQTELAQMYLILARYKMIKDEQLPLEQLKDTLLHGGFNTAEEKIAWLSKPKIMGDNIKLIITARKHAEYSLTLNPVQYQALILLEETGFLVGKSHKYDEALIKQALKIGPYHADVQMAAGLFYWTEHNYEESNQHFKIAFKRSGNLSMKIIEAVCANMPVDEFIKIFEPDPTRIGYMAHYYAVNQDLESLAKVSLILAQHYDKEAIKLVGKTKTEKLLQAAETYQRAGIPEQADRRYQLALENSPHDTKLVSSYALFLYQQQKYDQALPKLQWAYQHEPDNKQLRETLDECLKHTLSTATKNQLYR